MVKERIDIIITHSGLTPSKFADKLGVQRSGVSHILSGRNNPSLDFLMKVLNHFPEISGDWLITGNGNMLKAHVQSSVPKQLSIEDESAKQDLIQKKLASSIKINRPEPNKNTVENNQEKIQNNAVNTDIPTQALNIIDDKEIERIVVFYTDKTFRDYRPE